MNDAVKHALGDLVYLRVDSEYVGIVTAVVYRPHGHLYYISWNSKTETAHYDSELVTDPTEAVVSL